MQTNSLSIQTNKSIIPAISPTPFQRTNSSEWFCDERWSVSNNIYVGTVKEVKPAETLGKEKRIEFDKYLLKYSLKNLLHVEIEKVYKGSEKDSAIEILNVQTADVPAIEFKTNEKYLLYLDRQTIKKGETLFYFARSDSKTKLFSETAETIAFLEKNFNRNVFEAVFGSQAKGVITGGLVSGKAILLPKPKYPEDAKKDNASGRVEVYVLVGENGHVIQAKAICPIHPSLGKAAEEAALTSRYSPIFVRGKQVKVRGVVVYDFVP